MEHSPDNRPPFGKSDALRSYFVSGWLPFLPYLALYLLFWGFGGPVSTAKLLFGLLHVIHLALLVAVLVLNRPIFKDPRVWFFLSTGIIFLIQGASMEFPNDNWSHVQRIFCWDLVPSFSDPIPYEKYKSGFFFLYTIVGWFPYSLRPCALSATSALMAVLLVYQIWRFLRFAGLSDVTAFLAVLAALLFMGTPIQFFGYYALSSTSLGMIGSLAALSAPLSNSRPRLRAPLWLAALFLSTFNHVQSLGIVLLGTAALATWHAQLKFGTGRVLVTLTAAALLLFAAAALAVTYLPAGQNFWQNLAPIREDGWLTSFGNFPIWEFQNLDAMGPATRFLEIVTWSGLLNFAAAAILIARRRFLGWLTLAPLALILYPVSATLLADAVVADPSANIINIIIFHRYFLLALPLAALIDLTASTLPDRRLFQNLPPFKTAALPVVGAAIILVAAIPSGRHWLGKLDALGHPTPGIAQLDFLAPLVSTLKSGGHLDGAPSRFIADPATSTFLVTHFGVDSSQLRLDLNESDNPVFGNTGKLEALIGAAPFNRGLMVIVPKMAPELPLHYSSTGFITGHWRSFAINGCYQFDPTTLLWCEENLTPAKGWTTLELGPWHRGFSRPIRTNAP